MILGDFGSFSPKLFPLSARPKISLSPTWGPKGSQYTIFFENFRNSKILTILGDFEKLKNFGFSRGVDRGGVNWGVDRGPLSTGELTGGCSVDRGVHKSA